MAANSQVSVQDKTSTLTVIANFFKEQAWPFSLHETEPILQIRYQGENAEWFCNIKVREEKKQIVFYSIAPVNIPPKKRLAIAEFLTRANYGLNIGNFEMDFSDGEVRFKTYNLNIDGQTLSSETIGQLIFVNVMIMDRYLPGIMSVTYADISSENAINRIEASSEGLA